MKNRVVHSKSATLVALFLTALTTAALAADPASVGLPERSRQAEAGMTRHELVDADGVQLFVLSGPELTDAQIQTVAVVHRALKGWTNMSFSSMRISIPGTRAEALLVPDRYSSDGLDLTGYLPSGMQFYFDNGYLEYDFRMKVGTIFLRVNGPFIDEAQLTARVVTAARDPIRFLERTDPAYLYLTLQQVTETLNKLDQAQQDTVKSLQGLVSDYEGLKSQRPLLVSKLAEIDQEIDSTGEAIKKTDTTLTSAIDDLASALVSLNGQLAAQRDDLQKQLDGLRKEHEDLVAQVGKLKEEKDALSASHAAYAQSTGQEIEALRAAILTLHNTGFLSGPKPMDPQLVKRVVELKGATPTMTTADILTTLKAESIKASAKQVDAIVWTYFGL